MSVHREYTVWCDSDSCAQWTGQAERSTQSARAAAKEAGWSYVTGKAKDGSKKKFDLCPHCTRSWDELLGR